MKFQSLIFPIKHPIENSLQVLSITVDQNSEKIAKKLKLGFIWNEILQLTLPLRGIE